jgi:hypothetical protein
VIPDYGLEQSGDGDLKAARRASSSSSRLESPWRRRRSWERQRTVKSRLRSSVTVGPWAPSAWANTQRRLQDLPGDLYPHLLLTAANLLDDGVITCFDEHEISLTRVVTGCDTDYFSNPKWHEYEIDLTVEDIDHFRSKMRNPQDNGICECFNKTILNEFCRVAFGKKTCRSSEELQADLDAWMSMHMKDRPHEVGWCYGRILMQTFLDSFPLVKEKMLVA